MNRNVLGTAPAYIDGAMEVYDIIDKPGSGDFPERVIRSKGLGLIWFRQEAIYDRTRVTYEQADLEITRKLRIPRWDGISSGCVCIIEGTQHRVHNCAQVISRQGYPETEITLVKPENVFPIYP